MTRNEFLQVVQLEGIRQDSFSLDEDRNETYVLVGSGQTWDVYYSERGQQTNVRHFPAEADALDYLLTVLRGDPSTKIVSFRGA